MFIVLGQVFLVIGQVFLAKDKCFEVRTSVLGQEQVFLV